VVETSSTGAEILCLIVPDGKECLVVKLREGSGAEICGGFAFLVVKARARDMIGVDNNEKDAVDEVVRTVQILLMMCGISSG